MALPPLAIVNKINLAAVHYYEKEIDLALSLYCKSTKSLVIDNKFNIGSIIRGTLELTLQDIEYLRAVYLKAGWNILDIVKNADLLSGFEYRVDAVYELS